MGEFPAPSLGCLLRVLFTPSASLAATVASRQHALFGSAPYDGVHLRLGDGAKGTAFKAGTAPLKDVRMSIDDAFDVLGNLQYKSPLFSSDASRSHPIGRAMTV